MAEWNFSVNLAGVAPAGTGARNLPTGYYKGKIVDADGTVASTGRPQVAFKVEITDPEYAGVVRTTWLGIPQSADDGVRYYWRAAFESAGYTPAQIEAGTINASPALFVGREVTIHYTAGDKDAGQRDSLKFLSPGAWEQGKKSEGAVANAGSNGSALGGGAKVTMPNTQAVGGMGGGMAATVTTPAGGGLGGGLGGAPKGGVAAADLLKALGA
jgi:hypothetical protein